MKAEEKMNNIINSFKDQLAVVAEGAISDVYSEILPHVENDTFMNVTYRSQRVIENMIAGKFERVNKNTVSILDDNHMSVEIKITDNQWDSIRESLIKAMPACPKDLEIKSLKRQIEILEQF